MRSPKSTAKLIITTCIAFWLAYQLSSGLQMLLISMIGITILCQYEESRNKNCFRKKEGEMAYNI